MTLGHIIGGETKPSASGKTYSRIDPVTQEVATVCAAAGVEEVNAAVAAAHQAFAAWSETGPNARRTLLLKAADLMEARTPDFIAAMTEETGSTGPWGGFNCYFAAKILREAAALTSHITGTVIPSDKPGCMSMGVRQAVGVCVGLAPWNAPVILGVRAIAAALACGNTVILRSSEACPRTHHLIGEVMLAAGFPAGVVNVLHNAPEDAPVVVEALIAHPLVKRINFTGSSRVGKIIAKLAAEHLKPVLLELGGKAPFIVLEDADLDQAVAAAAFGAFMNQGQICMSTERFIVVDAIADQFVDKFAAKARSLPAGNPRDKVVLGSLVDLKSAEKMDQLIADAVAKGAKVVAGGKRTGAIVEATLIDQVRQDMRIYREESFGPVKSIIRVKDEAEAIAVANDTEYGLSSAVFTRDIARGLAAAKKIQSGICHVNGPTVGDEAQAPFGGVKDSGYGRFGGTAVIAEFTELRWVTIEGPQHYPF
ncbi:aldehyde dehydrogenase [Oryzibacter oryziterrae]|uniref:aldehyde dehydrogenase n=1 Tax=Oryzibacter oryziterrae TaxID=2766474 RepID=UPI001F165FAD|nr:aldehyde dehydrogenase [Oryzibacter oryziterrae]